MRGTGDSVDFGASKSANTRILRHAPSDATLAASDGESAEQLASSVLSLPGRIIFQRFAWNTKQETQVHTNRFGTGQHLSTQARQL